MRDGTFQDGRGQELAFWNEFRSAWAFLCNIATKNS